MSVLVPGLLHRETWETAAKLTFRNVLICSGWDQQNCGLILWVTNRSSEYFSATAKCGAVSVQLHLPLALVTIPGPGWSSASAPHIFPPWEGFAVDTKLHLSAVLQAQWSEHSGTSIDAPLGGLAEPCPSWWCGRSDCPYAKCCVWDCGVNCCYGLTSTGWLWIDSCRLLALGKVKDDALRLRRRARR